MSLSHNLKFTPLFSLETALTFFRRLRTILMSLYHQIIAIALRGYSRVANLSHVADDPRETKLLSSIA